MRAGCTGTAGKFVRAGRLGEAGELGVGLELFRPPSVPKGRMEYEFEGWKMQGRRGYEE